MTSDIKSTENVANIINKEFSSSLIAYGNIRTVDIVKNTVNKANGVEFLYNLLKSNNNISKILTAGDSNNDIEMIKKYDGYVQINARENVKAVSSKYFNFISDIIYKEL